MIKRNNRADIDECLDRTASANECTGALQHIAIDPNEVAKFHAQFVGEDKI
ncbi:MAG: hypothetical protein ACI4MS_00225 [Candidatus Coproplasma sp.]